VAEAPSNRGEFDRLKTADLVLPTSSSATNNRHGFPNERLSIRQIEIACFHKGEHRYVDIKLEDP
jgi:hypothetical protein